MNLGIQQTSRISSRRKETSQKMSLRGDTSLNDMAKAFGLDVSTLGEQAESMWEMLNNLHDTDPAGYDNFIKDQIKEMNSAARGERTLTPEKGFVVKTFVKASNGTKDVLKKLFVNFCSHEAVEKPIDRYGEKVSDSTKDVANAQIPMIISSLRDFKDMSGSYCHTIDVVLNPWCLKRCTNDSLFKSQVVSLGLSSIREEKEVSMQAKWKLIRSSYKGGLGEKQMEVHPFSIDAKMLNRNNKMDLDDENKYPENINTIMNDPQSLLHSLKYNDETQNDLMTLETGKNSSNVKSRCLIQEIDPQAESIEKLETASNDSRMIHKDCSAGVQGKQSLAKQMKGFLNKKESYRAIYQKPSTGDGTSGRGGSYSKFMSKCQVIDTADLASTSMSSKQPLSTDHTTENLFTSGMKKGFLKSKKNGFSGGSSEVDECDGYGHFDTEFHAIMKRTDPNFARAFDDKVRENSSEDFEDAIKTLVDGMDGSKKDTIIQNNKTDLNIPIEPDHRLSGKDESNKQIPYKIIDSGGSFGVCLDLSDTKVLTVDDVTVEICNDKLCVTTKCGKQLKYINAKISVNVTAKFKAKKKSLYLQFSVS